MDRFRATLPGYRDDGVNTQIALHRRSRADTIGLVGLSNVLCSPICFRINGDRADAHLMAGSHDTHGDFSTVRDQNFMKHAIVPDFSGCSICSHLTIFTCVLTNKVGSCSETSTEDITCNPMSVYVGEESTLYAID